MLVFLVTSMSSPLVKTEDKQSVSYKDTDVSDLCIKEKAKQLYDWSYFVVPSTALTVCPAKKEPPIEASQGSDEDEVTI